MVYELGNATKKQIPNIGQKEQQLREANEHIVNDLFLEVVTHMFDFVFLCS